MSTVASENWLDANQRYLSAALTGVRACLEYHVARSRGTQPTEGPDAATQRALFDQAGAMSPPPALETLCAMFGLSSFERELLVLCAGVELDSRTGPLCAAAQGDPQRPYPTFSLALAALSQPHWSALSPAAPLRRWRLIELGPGSAVTLCPLRIDERVLHYLTGVQHLDAGLQGLVERVPVDGGLVPSHQALAQRLAAAWGQNADTASLPVVQLCGEEVAGKRSVAAAACAMLGMHLYAMSSYSLPASPAELDTLIRLWEREAALGTSALLLDCEDPDGNDPLREHALDRFLESTGCPLILACREQRCMRERPVVNFDVCKPTSAEQRSLWQSALGSAASRLDGQVDALVAQFHLSASAIRSVCAEALGRQPQAQGAAAGNDLASRLWDASCAQARPRLGHLAHRIEPVATWDDLVLPEPQCRTLRDIALHVRQRARVYETWGLASKSARGLGISALFTGASGTGKTMAAEVLARDLRLELYRIDLSQVVNKYIGETEKNLRHVFDAAEGGGAILFFDEADALFGKRSEVKDSHDRYANIEVSYLLQRMEAYRGLAILTTNMREALDAAFLRRIRFVVQFPFPDAAQRAEIWRRIFPAGTPTENLDVDKLARLNVPGGSIRNIALYAAFLAADASVPVGMVHLLRAARAEYGKLQRPLTEAETGGWV